MESKKREEIRGKARDDKLGSNEKSVRQVSFSRMMKYKAQIIVGVLRNRTSSTNFVPLFRLP